MCGYLNSFACDVSRATGFGQLRLLCKHLILLVFGPMADDNIIPSCSKDKPSLVYIKRGGGQILLHAGHQYSRKEKYKNGAEVWECIHRRKVQCGGKITLKATDIIGEKQHKCTPDFAKNIIDERLNECKTKLSSSEFPTIQSTFDATVASCKDAGLDLIKTIPSFSSVRSTLYRHRNASVGMKKILFGNVEEVIVPDRYSDFLLADYSCQDKRILVFATQKGRNIMAKGEDFLGDGTFRSCSYPFQQLYVLHCDVGSTEQVTNIVPVVYALMSDKTTETYKILFFIIKAQIPEWTPVTFKTDFEMAVMNAISSVFPTVITKGCYFHFSKAIWKKGKELGLTNSKTTRRQVALSAVLPLLPANEIFNGWFYVAAQSPDDLNSQKFRQYMIKQWLRDEFVQVWCMFGERHRTTNALEGWHNRLNKAIKIKQPNILQMLHGLYSQASYYDVISIQIENNKRFKPQRKNESILRDNFIRETSREFLNGEISIGHFLEKLR